MIQTADCSWQNVPGVYASTVNAGLSSDKWNPVASLNTVGKSLKQVTCWKGVTSHLGLFISNVAEVVQTCAVQWPIVPTDTGKKVIIRAYLICVCL